ncbi:MAG: fatty acid desaturase [Halioglobus sp.]|jgi:fatty acid desaturase
MKIGDYLSKDEIARFTAKSDFHGARLLLGNWLAIAGIFALVALYTHVVTVLLAVILLGGRQLGLSVLMHECGHRSLFKTPALNDFFGQWLCALPVMNDLPSYAKGHLLHHRNAGTGDDPDLVNYQDYPITKASFKRKIARDLTGRTGVKILSFIARGSGSAMSSQKRSSAKPFYQQVAVQLILLAVLWLCQIPWAYLLWATAYMTSFMLFIRLRQIAEHAAVPDLYDLDPRKYTRTVIARWWERLLLAPNAVNYHMEHHFMASVPCYHLKALNQHLVNIGALDEMPRVIGYPDVFRSVVTA